MYLYARTRIKYTSCFLYSTAVARATETTGVSHLLYILRVAQRRRRRRRRSLAAAGER